MRSEFLDGRVVLHQGDARDVLRELPDNHFHSCATDPPYALASIVKRFGNTSLNDDTQTSERARQHLDGMARLSSGFMGQSWDTSLVAHSVEFWREVFRVLRPGAHLVAFGGTRTFHRLVCAIEDSGFEIRDTLSFLYGSGFPKSHNQGEGRGTALKPACELITLARKPFEGTVAANLERWDCGALNIDACRVEAEGRPLREVHPLREGLTYEGHALMGRVDGSLQSSKAAGVTDLGRWPANVLHDGSAEVIALFPDAPGAQREVNETFKPKQGTAVYGDYGPRPRLEPRGDSGSAARFFQAIKPDEQEETCRSTKSANDAENHFNLKNDRVASVLSDVVEASAEQLMLQRRSVQAANMNVSAKEFDLICASATETIQSLERRFSLGFLPESISAMLGPVNCVATRSQIGTTRITISLLRSDRFVVAVTFDIIETSMEAGASVYAGRFHYTSKAHQNERIGSMHPTVKPLDLMQWLIRLVCPKNGCVLDPFAGSGTTGEAAWREGASAVLIEKEQAYCADIGRRMQLATCGPVARASAIAKAKGERDDDIGPLFERKET